MKNSFSKNRVNYVIWTMIAFETLIALIFYSFLPNEIPMQWNGVAVIWYADKLAIFSYPMISLAIIFFLKPMIISRFNAPIVSNLAMVGLNFVILSCQIYTIAYCFGLRWRIDYLLLIESVCIVGFGLFMAWKGTKIRI